ncbi:MAG TPA: hypothetical protein VIX89_06560 [Bryobacteraceae bacterium]
MRLPAILALTCWVTCCVAALAATTGAGIRYQASGLDANGKHLSSTYSAKLRRQAVCCGWVQDLGASDPQESGAIVALWPRHSCLC